MQQAVLEVSGLEKNYGRVRALRGVDLVVNGGEFVVLLGPNGAGKSTLFQVLTGLFHADAGEARIEGHDLTRHPVRALAAIGVVFQQPTIDLDMSVRGNLRFGAMLQGLSGELCKQRIRQGLHDIQLEADAERKVRELSGGNRRRVELARAMLHAPRIVLMDEASVGLDPASRQDLILRVRNFCNAHGPGVLWATHLVDEAAVADRVVVLDHGRILADMPPEQLMATTSTTSVGDAFLELTGKGAAA